VRSSSIDGWCYSALLSDAGEIVDEFPVPPDADGLRALVRRVGPEPVRAVIESMTGARFVHDRLEELGWDVLIADAQKVKGIAPLACKTDRIDARVLSVLSQRDLVPEIWLPTFGVRQERELARFRLHLVKHRSMLKHRVHASLISFGKPCPVTDLFGVAGRQLLSQLAVPEPWRGTITASVELIDDLERQIAVCNGQLRALAPEHRYVATLMTTPGIGRVLAYTIAAEIGDIGRFATADKLVGYTGLCPRHPVRRQRPPRTVDQVRAEVPALGHARSDDACAPPSGLRRALLAHQAPHGQAARREGRPDRYRPTPDAKRLAHAHLRPALQPHHRCRRRRFSSGRLETVSIPGAGRV
jgi:transposase